MASRASTVKGLGFRQFKENTSHHRVMSYGRLEQSS